MDENADESAPACATDRSDNASPSPFRKFPYVQLVFCLACLAMTAWTWMRYSYCWKMGTASLVKYGFRRRLDQDTMLLWPSAYDASRMDNRYVELSGRMTPRPATSRLQRGNWYATLYVAEDYVLVDLNARGDLVEGWFEMTGRLHLDLDPRKGNIFFDTTASRFHPASVAGLVVGAMGCSIFGLYLRAWLRERKAAA